MKPSGPQLPMLGIFIFNLCQGALVINAFTNSGSGTKPYIVYMGELPDTNDAAGLTTADSHNSLLLEAIGEERIAKESIIHSYTRSFNGFVARLLPHEATLLSGTPKNKEKWLWSYTDFGVSASIFGVPISFPFSF